MRREIFERAQELVDRRRLVIGLCAAAALALIAAIPGVLSSADNGAKVHTGAFAQVTPTTASPVVNASPLDPALSTTTSTTNPALVLGSTFSRPTTTVPNGPAPKPAPKPAAAPAPPAATTTPTARVCHNSYDTACGPFYWDPKPAPDQPRQVTLSSQSQTVQAGQPVTIHAVVYDPDDSQAFKCPSTLYDFGDGPAASTHCDPPPNSNPCPIRSGPWTPPAANAGGGQEDVAHTFATAGTYTVKFTYDPGYEDACYNPYASNGSGTLTITVTPATP